MAYLVFLVGVLGVSIGVFLYWDGVLLVSKSFGIVYLLASQDALIGLAF